MIPIGTRGPIPNRDADLARPRSRKGGDQQETTKGIARPTTIPEPDPDWHPIALMLWNSLAESGQADYYQQSDWAFAYSVCEDVSLYKKPLVNKTTGEEYHKRSGQMLAVIYSAMSSLLVTEADRRRVRLELQQPEPEEDPAAVLVIADYQQALARGKADE